MLCIFQMLTLAMRSYVSFSSFHVNPVCASLLLCITFLQLLCSQVRCFASIVYIFKLQAWSNCVSFPCFVDSALNWHLLTLTVNDNSSSSQVLTSQLRLNCSYNCWCSNCLKISWIPCWQPCHEYTLTFVNSARASWCCFISQQRGCDAMFDLSAWGPNLLKLEPKWVVSATVPVCRSKGSAMTAADRRPRQTNRC